MRVGCLRCVPARGLPFRAGYHRGALGYATPRSVFHSAFRNAARWTSTELPRKGTLPKTEEAPPKESLPPPAEREDLPKSELESDPDVLPPPKEEGFTLLHKLVYLGLPVALIGFMVWKGVHTLQEYRQDARYNVDPEMVLSFLFQSTIYQVIDNKAVIKELGQPLYVEPNRAKFKMEKKFAWISYPVIAPHEKVATVTIDFEQEPPKESGWRSFFGSTDYRIMWRIKRAEVDFNDGHKIKVELPTELQEPFDIVALNNKLLREVMRQQMFEHK